MKKINPVFSKEEMLFCSIPVPPINNHKGGTFDFTQEQIEKYGQSQTHPSIVYKAEGWNGHKYWLATTPYPHIAGVFENACIYYGDEDESGNPPRIFTPISVLLAEIIQWLIILSLKFQITVLPIQTLICGSSSSAGKCGMQWGQASVNK